MPIKINLDAQTGRVMGAIVLLGVWSTYTDGPIVGLVTIMSALPVLYLLQLPLNYKEGLLKFTTKCYAILLIPSFLLYWLSLFTTVPSIGIFVQTNYPPFINHVFYLESTYDNEIFMRFNAFFVEPGHQAILSTFLIIANRFRFRVCPWLWILLLAVIFSFSLAGYILLVVGFVLLKVNSLLKAIAIGALGAALFGLASSWMSGDNAFNELILTRLEKDDDRGFKGNNRVNESTKYIFSRVIKKGELWTGAKDEATRQSIKGAGYKMYLMYSGLIGVLLVLLFYLFLIPRNPDYRYTIRFFIVIALCFLQRAYPLWYSWLFPFVMGIYIAKGEKERQQLLPTES